MSFQSLLEHFYQTTGIEFKENREIINRKVTRFYADKGFKNYHDFFTAIKRDTQLYQELINLLTTSETYFYREFSQIELCLLKCKEMTHKIKILSAPCASGEEPYSILIAMLEAKIPLDNIEIYAIDINTQEIKHAKSGIFPHRRLHKLSPEIQKSYFTPLDDNQYQISSQLREHVHFKQMNLFDPLPAEFINFDIIFSRNMLIYFDELSQKRAERIFYDRLRPGGYLLVGHADKIHLITKFTMLTHQGTHYYQK